MDGRWDAWAPNAFLEQSGPADQPTYPDGLLLPNSSHAGAGEAVEDLLHPGLPVGGHRLQQGDALRERPGPLQGLAELVRRTRPPESPSRWVYTPEPGKWACPYRAMRRWGHILQMRRSHAEQLHQRLACKPASAARARDLLQHLPTPLTPGDSATSPWCSPSCSPTPCATGVAIPPTRSIFHIQRTDAGVRIEMVQPYAIFEPGEVRRRVPGEGRGRASCSWMPWRRRGGWMGLGAAYGPRCPCPAPSASGSRNGSRNSSQHGPRPPFLKTGEKCRGRDGTCEETSSSSR